MSVSPDRFAALWRSLLPIGRDGRDGGYLRYSWSEAELACREWFVEEALDRDLEVEIDGNGNLWAWWGSPDDATADADRAIVTGSHLDSVPHGGAYDGPLGVVSALLGVDIPRGGGRRVGPPPGVRGVPEGGGARF